MSGLHFCVSTSHCLYLASVGDETVSSTGKGLLVLVGIGTDDKQEDIVTLTKKILTLRMWPDPKTDAPWKLNVKDIDSEILCVSQFTLMANTTKGNKPDYHRAMAPELSRVVYSSFLERLGADYAPSKVQDGRFGAMMMVSSTNDGPVTFTLDSRKFEYTSPKETPGRKTPVVPPSSVPP